MKAHWPLVVIGAGPAGLAAATTAARQGVEVAVLDEQALPGGQIFRSIEAVPAGRAETLGPDYRRGADLVQAFRDSGAAWFPRTRSWSLSPDLEIGVVREAADGNSETHLVRADRILVAIGAMERAVPFPGWTLPGVMNAGAGQVLMKAAGVVPEHGVVLAGTGPLLLLLAWQYMRAGVEVKGILETSPRSNLLRALPSLPGALLARHYLAKGLRYLLDLRRAGVPVTDGVDGLRALGEASLDTVEYRRGKRLRRIETELLLVHFGLVPNAHLARSAGCRFHWDQGQQCSRPDRDEWGNTSVEGIMVAGDNAHIGGARAAEHAGRLAALEALRAIGKIDAVQRDRLAAEDRAWMDADLRIRPFLEALYRLPQPLLDVPDDGTVVCRCEEVDAGAVRAAVAAGHRGVNQVKFLTRCGMGPCQGRQCGDAVGHIVAKALGKPMDAVGFYRNRPPVKPLTIGELATLGAPPRGPGPTGEGGAA